MKIMTLDINNLKYTEIAQDDSVRLVADDTVLEVMYENGKWHVSTVNKRMSINPLVSNCIEIVVINH